ncbi:F0F1 ATP synthase subunit B [Minwuia sp.]|uniref:F0F1 ATP synthase subunit B family protein n=1 Tax=Minwuia sp. TaxID=2493630 RepID=UPI003A95588F
MFISTAYAATGEAGGSMFSDPTFWVAIAFVAFFALIFYLKVPGKLVAQLDARADRIRSELEEAKRLREEAQELYADYQRKAEEAAKEADAIVAHAREESTRLAEKMRKDMEDSLNRRKAQAESKIAQAEQQAIEDVRNRAVDIATHAAANILREEMKGSSGTALIDNAISDIGKHLH